jgi:hypothetical protein
MRSGLTIPILAQEIEKRNKEIGVKEGINGTRYAVPFACDNTYNFLVNLLCDSLLEKRFKLQTQAYR